MVVAPWAAAAAVSTTRFNKERIVAYQIAKTQPPAREPSLSWDTAAPGLYQEDEELLVELDGGHAVVSVVPTWIEGNQGVSLMGVGRLTNEEGETILCHGLHVESAVTATVTLVDIEKHGINALKKEVLLALLGEPPALTKEIEVTGKEPVIVPVLGFSDQVRLNASIRHAKKAIEEVQASAHPADLL
jgi:hypothetical protein